MPTILFDTDYLIDFLRGQLHVQSLIEKALSNDQAYISILSVYEIYSGMRQEEKGVTQDFIDAFQIEPVTVQIAKQAGMARFRYRQRGISLSVVDCIIAETARVRNHLVATMHKKHYPDTEFYKDH